MATAESGIVPRTLAWGRRCLDEGAEPMFAVVAAIDNVQTNEADRKHWLLDGIKVYAQGRYMTVRDWIAAGKPGLH